MNSPFKPLKSNCPICNGASRGRSRGGKDCRQSTLTNWIHCKTGLELGTPSGWIYRGEDSLGFGMYSEDDGSTPEQRREIRRFQLMERQLRDRQRKEELAKALPAKERDGAIRVLSRNLGLTIEHRKKLRDRGLTNEQIDAGGFFTIVPNTDLKVSLPVNLPGISRGYLRAAGRGIACPSRTLDGMLSGWQLRLDVADGGKYRWAKGDLSSHLPNGELPITVCIPSGADISDLRACEGILKPYVASCRLNLPFIGASGALFSKSSEQVKEVLTQLQPKRIVLPVDAGDVKNLQVAARWLNEAKFFQELGYTVVFEWWNQVEKSGQDIDEITLEQHQAASMLSIAEFTELCRAHGGYRASEERDSQKQGEAEPYTAEYEQYVTQEEQQNEWDRGFDSYLADREHQQKVQWLAAYPERVQKTQQALQDITPYVTETQDSKYVEMSLENLTPGIYGLAAGMGSGKTFLIKQAINHFSDGLLLSYRNSLLIQTCRSREVADKISFLWDLQNRAVKYTEIPWIGACVESIVKLPSKKVVILEEVEKIVNALLQSPTCRRERREKLRCFTKVLQQAEYIIAADADISPVSLRYLQKLSGKQVHLIHNIHKRFEWQCFFHSGIITPRGEQRPNSRKDFENRLLDAASSGEKLLIPTDSQRWGQALERQLQAIGLCGLRIDSFTKVEDPRVDAFLTNPDKWIEENQPDYIIYSPTAEASLDITIQDYFDGVWGCFFGIINHWGCKQMLGRLRTNCVRHIFIKTFSTIDNRASKSPLPQVVALSLIETSQRTIEQLGLNFPAFAPYSDATSEYYTNPHFETLTEIVAKDNWSRANLRENLAEELRKSGHNVILLGMAGGNVIVPNNPIAGHKEDILREWADIIANSEDISIQKAYDILSSSDAKPEERWKAIKATLLDRLPGLELTPNFIFERYLKDPMWIGKQELRWMLHHPEVAKDIDTKRLCKAIENEDMPWDVRTRTLALKALQVLEIPQFLEAVQQSHLEWHTNSPIVHEFKERAIANRKLILLALGINANQDSDGCYLLRRCLEKIGVPLIRRQRRVEGQRVWFCQVDTTALTGGDHAAAWGAFERRFECHQPTSNIDSIYISAQLVTPEIDEWLRPENLASMASDFQRSQNSEELLLYFNLYPTYAVEEAAKLLPPQFGQWVLDWANWWKAEKENSLVQTEASA
ncbi:hypothetical protein F7734_39005 [Scytonema sp. UIC 10036]|uniref:plasmid replication protein, CyRepA1 family n=1 Tax=Scytonema sp. UIC 10036 TaxID=2304196 RepID=UPI0012DAB059|nr:plasmid replication protein, CyRepA1 family [Scytonema sp. UIC 10036]MUG97981.1 hypothetical protein [Scytonema sp. UIC 10036]